MSAEQKDIEIASHEEHPVAGALSIEDREFLANLPVEIKKAAVDWNLIPLLTFLYLMSYIDRTNIGNVKIEGIMDDLDLSGNRFNVAQCIFFAPYCLFEIPSNWILTRVKRPSWYLGGLVISWGLVMTFSGFVQSYESLLVVRFMLGLTEAGFYPGALYLISNWYMPGEIQMRVACFYSASAAAGAFSGLLAFAIAKLDGVGGYRGWRWIFLLEGAVSVLGGIVCLLCLPDTPALSTRFLNQEEIRYLETRKRTVQRINQEARTEEDGSGHRFPWKVLRSVLLDWQIYLTIVMYWSNAVPNYAVKFNMPAIIKSMGYTSAKAQLLTIPPYTIGAISALVSSWFADRYTWRMPFIAFGQILLIISFAILYVYGYKPNDYIGQCYFALMLGCVGFYPILPGTNAWILSNLAGPTKRAMGIAWLVSLGNLGGIPGSFIFKESEAPRYPTAYATSFSIAAAGIVAALTLEFGYWSINKRRAKKSETEWRDMYSEEQLEKMGDRSPLFKYTL
ncbi:hypothetical protein FDECE_1191 [Fusarium decemcellulare]|nr:hypothetical protein FDECE_1191 [Fusarium decemcellulare]